jgi:hypothetical protein
METRNPGYPPMLEREAGREEQDQQEAPVIVEDMEQDLGRESVTEGWK